MPLRPPSDAFMDNMVLEVHAAFVRFNPPPPLELHSPRPSGQSAPFDSTAPSGLSSVPSSAKPADLWADYVPSSNTAFGQDHRPAINRFDAPSRGGGNQGQQPWLGRARADFPPSSIRFQVPVSVASPMHDRPRSPRVCTSSADIDVVHNASAQDVIPTPRFTELIATARWLGDEILSSSDEEVWPKCTPAPPEPLAPVLPEPLAASTFGGEPSAPDPAAVPTVNFWHRVETVDADGRSRWADQVDADGNLHV